MTSTIVVMLISRLGPMVVAIVITVMIVAYIWRFRDIYALSFKIILIK